MSNNLVEAEDLDDLDHSNIITTGRRTRGKKFDYSKFNDEDDEDFDDEEEEEEEDEEDDEWSYLTFLSLFLPFFVDQLVLIKQHLLLDLSICVICVHKMSH